MSILNESLLTLHDASRFLPRNRVGKPVNFSTIWRWVLKGVRAIDGNVVKLEAARVGGRWLTSREALERFSAALTTNTTEAPALVRTPAQRQRASEAAAKRLKDIGI